MRRRPATTSTCAGLRALLTTLVFFGLCVCAPNLAAQETPATPHSYGSGVFFGGGVFPLEVSGMENIHASDWQNYGLGASEGRVALPLGDGNMNGFAYGLKLGFDTNQFESVVKVPSWLMLAGDLGIYFGSMNVFAMKLGANLHFVDTEAFGLAFAPRGGFMLGFMGLGNVEVLPNKTPPVITENGTLHEGDPIRANLPGFTASANMIADFRFTDNLGIRLDVGYQVAAMLGMSINSGTDGDVTLNMDDPALVEPDGSSTQAGLEPKGNAIGFVGTLGVFYRR
ncbi:MAG: hypothetical protein ACQEVA_21170 [Myxococcota bacterium]